MDEMPRTLRLPEGSYTLAGKTFGRLSVLGMYAGKKTGKKAKWVTRCDCGRYVLRSTHSLRTGVNMCGPCQEVANMPVSATRIEQVKEAFSR